jgi:hypothetical protein
MRLETENNMIVIDKIFNPIKLRTNDGEEIMIQMRDSGFEFFYEGKQYSAQKGKITEVEQMNPTTKINKIPQSPRPTIDPEYIRDNKKQ